MRELFICPDCLKSHRKGDELGVYRCGRCGYVGRGYHRKANLDAVLAVFVDQLMAKLRALHVIGHDTPAPAPFDVSIIQPRDDVDFRAAVREFDRHLERALRGLVRVG